MTPKFSDYKTASAYQLREWAEGRPWHNPWAPDGSYGESKADGECCPDFSCCCPDMIWGRERRYAFVSAEGEGKYRMLLGALVNLTNPDTTYVAGALQENTDDR